VVLAITASLLAYLLFLRMILRRTRTGITGHLSNTTQVNYVRFGGSCSSDFIAGLFTVDQAVAKSNKSWYFGSEIAHIFTSKTNLRALKRHRMLSMSASFAQNYSLLNK